MKQRTLLVASTVLVMSASSAYAAVLAQYGTPSQLPYTADGYVAATGSLAAAAVSHVTVSDITPSANMGAPSNTTMMQRGNYGGSVSGDSNWFASTLQNWGTTGVADSLRYYEMHLSADSGYALQLSNLSFEWKLGVNANDTAQLSSQVYYSTDGVTFFSIGNLFQTESTTKSSGSTTVYSSLVTPSIDLSSLGNVDDIYLRIAFATNKVNGGGMASFTRDITVTGDVVAVPEPSTYAIAGGALALAACVVLRRRKKN